MTDKVLKKACIFDLTLDDKVLRKILGVFDWEHTPSKEEYLNTTSKEIIIFDMLEYADDISKNKQLTKQLKRVFKEELQVFFNE